MRTYVAVKGGRRGWQPWQLGNFEVATNAAQAFESPGNLAGNLGWQPDFLSCRKRNGARTPPA
jgi:hypothetical protein